MLFEIESGKNTTSVRTWETAKNIRNVSTATMTIFKMALGNSGLV